MKKIKYWILAMLLVPFGAQAVTVDVWMDPQNSGPYTIGDNFSVDIWASWDVALVGGAVKLEFDNSIINAVSSTMNISSSLVSSNGVIGTGVVNTIGFLTYMGSFAPGTYNVATVAFEAVGGGVSPLVVSDAANPVYGWEADLGNFNFESFVPTFTTQGSNPVGSATVVPLPAAAWFMMSGLGFLAFRRKRAA